MELYLLRHSIAVERGSRGFAKDSERPLTSKGEKRMEAAARGIKRLKLEFDYVISSPCLRAKRTAQITARVLRAKKKLCFSDHLSADASPRQMVHELKTRYAGSRGVILVGHEPFLSELISMLTTGSKALPLVFKKGGICRLSVTNLRYGVCASMHWVLTGRQLAMIGA